VQVPQVRSFAGNITEPMENIHSDDDLRREQSRGKFKGLHLPAKKITFGEMRASDVRDVRVNCRDHRYSRHVEISADRWPDHVRLSAIEPIPHSRCGEKGAVGRPKFSQANRGAG